MVAPFSNADCLLEAPTPDAPSEPRYSKPRTAGGHFTSGKRPPGLSHPESRIASRTPAAKRLSPTQVDVVKFNVNIRSELNGLVIKTLADDTLESPEVAGNYILLELLALTDDRW